MKNKEKMLWKQDRDSGLLHSQRPNIFNWNSRKKEEDGIKIICINKGRKYHKFDETKKFRYSMRLNEHQTG